MKFYKIIKGWFNGRSKPKLKFVVDVVNDTKYFKSYQPISRIYAEINRRNRIMEAVRLEKQIIKMRESIKTEKQKAVKATKREIMNELTKHHYGIMKNLKRSTV